ncbi:hypothetical protein GCM10022410_14000 [Amphibacillus indicireducens]|uniref:Uncharacterized protein n=1 Tax=Amphibacillus indicireducens TaxID=1076330 RepID=A0ABP7VKI9_9BACI
MTSGKKSSTSLKESNNGTSRWRIFHLKKQKQFNRDPVNLLFYRMDKTEFSPNKYQVLKERDNDVKQ